MSDIETIRPDEVRECAEDLGRRYGFKVDRAVRYLNTYANWIEEHGQLECHEHELPCDENGDCPVCREGAER